MLDRVADDPGRPAAVHGDVRKTAVPRFPYVILYREEPDGVLIVGVFHTSRDPASWQGRA